MAKKQEVEVIDPIQVVSTDMVEVIRPQLPVNWDYDISVTKMKKWVFNWKKLTGNILMELWIAREILSETGRPKSGTIVPLNKTWNDYCVETGIIKRTANRWLKRWTTPELPTPELPKDTFTIFYADPPWEYNNSGFDESAKQQYPTMSIEKLKELQIPKLTTKEGVIFMWCTNALLQEGLELLKTWKFNYKTNIAWVKNKAPSIGWFLRTKHELLLIGTKGAGLHPEVKHDSIVYADVRKHSQKPDIFYEMIEQSYPNQKYIELFARNKRNNWESWGNEL